LYDPPYKRKTRLYTAGLVPSMDEVQRITNQLTSKQLRPADVAVYISSEETVVAIRRFVSAFLEHVMAQEEEIMHAIIVYGYVCSR
jgi:hypothetical protein